MKKKSPAADRSLPLPPARRHRSAKLPPAGMDKVVPETARTARQLDRIEALLGMLNERENMNSFALAVPAALGPAAPRIMGGHATQPPPDRRPLTDCAMEDFDLALDRLYALVERLGDRLAPVRLAAPAITGASQGESPTPALPPLAQRMRDAKTKAGLVARNLETILDELEV